MESAAFAAALLVASLLTLNASSALQRTALALAGNWLAVMLAYFITGRPDSWTAFAAADAVAAFIVLSHPASRPQAVIGCIYIVQITVHLAYALVGSGPATGLYLNMLSGGGWLQIAVLAGGAIHGSGKRWNVSGCMGGVSPPIVAARSGGLAKGERERC
jgi:hypothetical protein